MHREEAPERKARKGAAILVDGEQWCSDECVQSNESWHQSFQCAHLPPGRREVWLNHQETRPLAQAANLPDQEQPAAASTAPLAREADSKQESQLRACLLRLIDVPIYLTINSPV